MWVLRLAGGPEHTETNHQPGPFSPPTTTGQTPARLPLTNQTRPHQVLVVVMVMMVMMVVVVVVVRWCGALMVRSGCTRCPRVTEDSA